MTKLTIMSVLLLGCAIERADDDDRVAQGASCTGVSEYKAGVTYAPGARVTAGGKIYQCKPFPYSGWCGQGGAYAPGSGWAWRDAWTESDSCSGSSTPPPPPSSSTCSAKTWVAGTWYTTGTVVSFGGKYYVAEHDNPGYDPTISTWFWDPTTCGETATPPPSGEFLISKSTFESMFPSRNAFYTYEGLVEATKKYPAFAAEGSSDARKREVAAFLANVAHETGNLVYVEEIAKGEYTDWGSSGCAPAAGKRYFGRGPIQLSWNYNYCAASKSIFGNQEVLRLDPDRVAREAWVAWATGIWYWMTATGPGTMTPHAAMANDRGFGETIRSINGSLECGGGNPAQVASRVDAYKRFCAMLGVSPGANLTC